MEIIHVPDILVYRGSSLHSLRGQQIVKGGELHTFGNGSGLVKDGKLYVLDGEDYVVRMETGKRSVAIGVFTTETVTLDWGDGTREQCYTNTQNCTHEYTDNLITHKILIKGTPSALTELYCQGNDLIILDVMPCSRLNILHCHSNRLTSLNINPNISFLSCSNNHLTSLDVHNNVSLAELTCYSNQLTQLDVSSNVVLMKLYCGDNPLNALYLSPIHELTLLNCVDTPLDKINLANALQDRNGLSAGHLYLSENVAGVQEICDAKNWKITIY